MKNRKKIKVGVLGATGSVGQRFVQLLDGHPWFEQPPRRSCMSKTDLVRVRHMLDAARLVTELEKIIADEEHL